VFFKASFCCCKVSNIDFHITVLSHLYYDKVFDDLAKYYLSRIVKVVVYDLSNLIEFGCEMLYPAIHTEYIDKNSIYSKILAMHMAVHPGSASRGCSHYNLN